MVAHGRAKTRPRRTEVFPFRPGAVVTFIARAHRIGKDRDSRHQEVCREEINCITLSNTFLKIKRYSWQERGHAQPREGAQSES